MIIGSSGVNNQLRIGGSSFVTTPGLLAGAQEGAESNAVLLSDGSVLVAGGSGPVGNARIPVAERFLPATRQFVVNGAKDKG